MASVPAAARSVVALVLSGCAVADMPPASHTAPEPGAEPRRAAPSRTPTPDRDREEPVPAAPTGEDGQHLEARYRDNRALARYSGEATYYGDALNGRRTASGEPFDPTRFTAAHRTLPFGTVVRVVCPKSHRAVYVRINDRGPFGDRRRIIDLSRAAAERLDMVRLGVANVRLEVVAFGRRKR